MSTCCVPRFPPGYILRSRRRHEFCLICLSRSSSFSTIFPRINSVNPNLRHCQSSIARPNSHVILVLTFPPSSQCDMSRCSATPHHLHSASHAHPPLHFQIYPRAKQCAHSLAGSSNRSHVSTLRVPLPPYLPGDLPRLHHHSAATDWSHRATRKQLLATERRDPAPHAPQTPSTVSAETGGFR